MRPAAPGAFVPFYNIKRVIKCENIKSNIIFLSCDKILCYSWNREKWNTTTREASRMKLSAVAAVIKAAMYDVFTEN